MSKPLQVPICRTVVDNRSASGWPRLWPFALKHANHVRNRVPHSGKTPYLVMTGNKPSLKHIRVFGCTAYVLRQQAGSKCKSRAVEGDLETLDHGI